MTSDPRPFRLKLVLGVALFLIAAQSALWHWFWVTAAAYLAGFLLIARGLWIMAGKNFKGR